MNALSDIARDYLADFEVLTDARNQLERELDEWWTVLVEQYVLPAVRKALPETVELSIWENQSRRGIVHIRSHDDGVVYLEVADPRHSESRDYCLTIYTNKASDLKAIRSNSALVERLNTLQNDLSLTESLFIPQSCLKQVAAEIDGTDAEATMKKIGKMAGKLFALIVEAEKG